jgi:hypothetical protein
VIGLFYESDDNYDHDTNEDRAYEGLKVSLDFSE